MHLHVHIGMLVDRRRLVRRLRWRDGMMDMHLQFGYGMMDHCRTLLSEWGGGTTILSPRDLDPHQLTRLASDLTKTPGGNVLLDPQFFLPHADHERLVSHDYWPNDYSTTNFWQGTELRGLLGKIFALNDQLHSSAVLLPGLYAERVDDDWLAHQKLTVDEAKTLSEGRMLFATVALAAEALARDEDLDELLASAETWDVSGVYVVCERPRGEYLTTDASWMANLLDLVAGLRLKGKRVIVGYCNHQMLVLAAAAANAIASGTWMNVRSFPPEKFRAVYDDEIKQRSTWYYGPVSLSEYKIPYLDIAKKQGLLSMLAPPPGMGGGYADALFAGAQPTSIKWTEQAAFRHYLNCLREQTLNAVAPTFDETADAHDRALDAAESLLASLHAAGVKGQQRDFRECIDVNRAALAVLRTSRGPMLRRKWATL
jgi:hypothetical protein